MPTSNKTSNQSFKPAKNSSAVKCQYSTLLNVLFSHEAYKMNGFLICNKGTSGTKRHQETYIFLDPIRQAVFQSGEAYCLTTDNNVRQNFSDSWALLNHMAPESLFKSVGGTEVVPFTAGFFSYEFLHEIEDVSHAKEKLPLECPSFLLYAYKNVAVYSHDSQSLVINHNHDLSSSPTLWNFPLEEALLSCPNTPEESTRVHLTSNNSHSKIMNSDAILDELEDLSSTSKETYIHNIQEIQELIRAGEVYQVNYSQRFEFAAPKDPFRLFMNIEQDFAETNSAFLSFTIEDKSNYIISASPELHFSTSGTNVYCSPIKGTAKRCQLPELDLRQIVELKNSEKNLAELAMIVDLVRNDLGRISEIGSVRVESYPRVETLRYVHHLVADVSARVKQDLSFPAIMRALFPCGSITGAPKIAAMKTIARLEKCTRGVYTGAIGFLGPGLSHFNVAIRTAHMADNRLVYGAGGGIVIDSDPAAEYLESLYKTAAFYQILRAGG